MQYFYCISVESQCFFLVQIDSEKITTEELGKEVQVDSVQNNEEVQNNEDFVLKIFSCVKL